MSSTTMPQRERLWTRDFISICVVAIAIRICGQLQNSVLPLYIQDLGYSKSAAGLMTTFYSISALFLRPFLGGLVDSKGRRPVLIVGTAIYAISAITIGFVNSLPVLFALRITSGIGFSANSVAISTMSTDVIPESRMTEGIGYFGLTQTLTMAIGPTIGLGLAGEFGYTSTFIAVFAFSAMGIALSFFVNYEKKRIKNDANAPENAMEEVPIRLEWWERIVERNSVVPSLMIIFVSFGSSAINTFLATFAKEMNIENIGLFFTFNAIGLAISRLFVGRITERVGRGRALVLGCIFAIASFLSISISRSLTPILFIGLIYGMAFGLLQTILNSTAIIATPKSRRGAANATFYMAMDMGVGIGAAMWGVVADMLGIVSIYVGAAAFIGVDLMMYFLFFRRRFADR